MYDIDQMKELYDINDEDIPIELKSFFNIKINTIEIDYSKYEIELKN